VVFLLAALFSLTIFLIQGVKQNMFTGMTLAVLLAILAVLSTLFGAWDKLTSRVRRLVFLAVVLIAIASISQVVQVIQKKEQLDTIAEQQQVIEDRNLFLTSNLGEIDEASGGASLGNVAYLVDDEEPSIFVFEYKESESKYYNSRLGSIPIPIVDNRPCNKRDWGKECTEGKPTKLNKRMIEDLEGAAVYNGKLYLTTSQSNAQDGTEERQRWLFLEVTLNGEIIRATRKLRDAIRETFKKGLPITEGRKIEESINEDKGLEVMQVEGLAIDENGLAYLGFRNPLVNNKALILRAHIDQLFSDNPQFESFVFDLERDGKNYGIVSLEYDFQNKQLLILGNSPFRDKTFPFVVWKLNVSSLDSKKVSRPESYKGDSFIFDAPGTRPTKPEVLLIPKPDHLHLFFDAVGTGGQLSFLRNDTELRRVRK
jgi:hypothetical protein